MQNVGCLFVICCFPTGTCVAQANAADSRRPNVVFVLVDDLGYGDLSCFSRDALCQTPNIDRLAAEGIQFTQFYVNSPICSASRAAFLTGKYPARAHIHGHLNSRQYNAALGQNDFLSPDLPCLPRVLQKAGYATGHFGKWHLGGGRDVDDAPWPTAYGFHESLVGAEGLGDRILPRQYGQLSQQSGQLGNGGARYVDLHTATQVYVDRAVDFITMHQAKPFFVQVWLNDVHTPYHPAPDVLARTRKLYPGRNAQQHRFMATLEEMDRHIGRLIKATDAATLAENTLFLLASDNGPDSRTPGSTAEFRGCKWSLYEGGIRMPLLARWKGKTPGGIVDHQSLLAAIDFFPTLCHLADITTDQLDLDGVDISDALFGRPVAREQSLYWEYGRELVQSDGRILFPPSDLKSPTLAIRMGKWKLLLNADGSEVELYDIISDRREEKNVALDKPAVSRALQQKLLSWKKTLP